MGPFVTETMFPISVKYIEKKNKAGLPIIMVVKDPEIEAKYKDHIKTINTMWLQPNWKQSNDVIRKATQFVPEVGDRRLNWQMYRGLLLETFMKEWDIKDKDGKTVPCDKASIDNLDVNIAAALIDAFQAKTSPSEDDLGN
jgi:hypothetical protein